MQGQPINEYFNGTWLVLSMCGNIMMLHPRDKKYTKTCDVVKVEIRFNLFPHPIIPSES
jgi:hypothetical protein